MWLHISECLLESNRGEADESSFNLIKNIIIIIIIKLNKTEWDRFGRMVRYLAAMPPCRRFETRGFPSLSMPPDTVSPSVVPSFFISSTTEQPRNSSTSQQEQVIGKNTLSPINYSPARLNSFISFSFFHSVSPSFVPLHQDFMVFSPGSEK